jgi:hypothetical protein
MNLHTRIKVLSSLGDYLLQEKDSYKEAQQRAWVENKWFIPSYISLSGKSIAREMLQASKLEEVAVLYQIPNQQENPRTIGLVMAGNIPFVGLQDLICVFLAGHQLKIKLSSKDTILIHHIVKALTEQYPELTKWISIQDMLKDCDAYIATGSDNSARYFNYYFGKYPHLIRSNRTSVAILQGDESTADLQALGHDIFDYFGLGCRNVSKVFVKNQEKLTQLLDAIQSFEWVANHHKYFNNYEYNKSIYLVNGTPHLDNGFLLLKESADLVSPIGVLFYEIYEDELELQSKLSALSSQIQCLVGSSRLSIPGIVSFGQTQCPAPWDYADGVDTLQFLSGLGV